MLKLEMNNRIFCGLILLLAACQDSQPASNQPLSAADLAKQYRQTCINAGYKPGTMEFGKCMINLSKQSPTN